MPLSGKLFDRTHKVPWPEALTAPARQIIRPESYVPGPLTVQIERLAQPGEPLEAQELLSLVAKLFFAFVHPGSQNDDLDLSDITRLFEAYHRQRLGRGDSMPQELAMRLSAWSLALRRVGDLPKVAAMVRDVADSRSLQVENSSFVGLDLGSGAGVFLLAQWILARRLGVKAPSLTGMEGDPLIGRRLASLMLDLGVADVLISDPRDPESYAPLKGADIHFVTNETIPVIFKRQGGDEFLAAHRALHQSLGRETAQARFFPDLVLADNARHRVLLELNPENRFQAPAPYDKMPLYPRAMGWEGRINALDAMGRAFTPHIPPRSLGLLPRRW